MSPQDIPEDRARQESDGESEAADKTLANKLSEELSNWRRRRHTGHRSRPYDGAGGGGGNFQPEPARTIKVRGHETLVIRKAKSAGRPPANSDSTNQSNR